MKKYLIGLTLLLSTPLIAESYVYGTTGMVVIIPIPTVGLGYRARGPECGFDLSGIPATEKPPPFWGTGAGHNSMCASHSSPVPVVSVFRTPLTSRKLSYRNLAVVSVSGVLNPLGGGLSNMLFTVSHMWLSPYFHRRTWRIGMDKP